MYTYTIKFRNEIIMKIVEVKSKNGINFMILDNNNEPIVDAVRYLKYLDSVKKSLNTKKTYAYALKKFFIYLEIKEIRYKEVNFDNFVDFIRWMKTPFEYENVLSYNQKQTSISPKTINLTITVVSNFYDYLYRSKKLDVNFYDFLHTESKYSKKYKSFMHHVNKDYGMLKNILKVKEPKKKLEVLTSVEVKELLGAANNIRDKFLIQLLYETGLRIGEVLSLRIGDIKFDFRKGHQIVLKNRFNDNGNLYVHPTEEDIREDWNKVKHQFQVFNKGE